MCKLERPVHHPSEPLTDGQLSTDATVVLAEAALEKAVGYLLVFVGGGIGAALRHGANRCALGWFGPSVPFGTLLVNVAGGLLMGMLAQHFVAKGGAGQELKLFLTTGILGGFTTFSAFSLDAAVMWQRGDYVALSAYVVGSVTLSIGAVFVGMVAVRAIT
jgi:CrcB protein